MFFDVCGFFYENAKRDQRCLLYKGRNMPKRVKCLRYRDQLSLLGTVPLIGFIKLGHELFGFQKQIKSEIVLPSSTLPSVIYGNKREPYHMRNTTGLSNKEAERPHLAKERHKNNDNINNKNTIVVKLHVLCYNKRPILKSPQYFFSLF